MAGEEISYDKIDADILYRLYRRKKWGGSHTSPNNILKVPSTFMNDYKERLTFLIKHGLIITKPTSYGEQISLNPSMSKEIKNKIRSFLKIDVI